MIIKGVTKKGNYYDSVSLMMIAKKVNELEGVLDSTVVMGTDENKSILDSAGLLIPEFDQTDGASLLIAVKAESDKSADAAVAMIEKMLAEKSSTDAGEYSPRSFLGALELLPEANLSLISVAGRYAYYEALKALNNNLHVMLFSDNVGLEQELELKKIAKEKGLLVMGPDCGTAIINGAPLGFANIVACGDIGIVGIVTLEMTGLVLLSIMFSIANC